MANMKLGAVAACVITVCACTEIPEEQSEALRLFSAELNTGTLVQACRNMATACMAQGRDSLACAAHQLFCAPTHEQICVKIKVTCARFGAGCDLHRRHCGGSSLPDAGLPISDAPPPQPYDMVTCRFKANYTGRPQLCRSSKGHSCSGIAACAVKVSGRVGEKLDWKSSCGGSGSTVIDGRADNLTFDCDPKSKVREQVRCVFSDATKRHSCRTKDNRGCEGYGGCTATVEGPVGERLTWTSSCGGTASTVMDGRSETATFKCAPPVSETVLCLFDGSTEEQTCTSSTGAKCSGIGSCPLRIQGRQGEKVEWTSTCGDSVTTVLDGKDEYAWFSCVEKTVRESVGCTFSGSTTMQTCTASTGEACSGITSCKLSMEGKAGQKISWKSSCGGYATTVLDGLHQTIDFKCSSTAREIVTCVFPGSIIRQSCKASNGASCSGVGSCRAQVQGTHGEKVVWSSSCGGEATTITDGKDEKASFQCPAPGVVEETLECVFASDVSQTCYALGKKCFGMGRCKITIAGKAGQTVSWTSSCGATATTVLDGKFKAVNFDCKAPPTP